jgi:hypothetical protein
MTETATRGRGRRLLRPVVPVALLAALALSCGSSSDSPEPEASPESIASSEPEASSESAAGADQVIDPGDGGDYQVEIDPADFSSVIDNPWSPMVPGTTWVYHALAGDETEEIIRIEVLDETRTVMGVETIVVHDVVSDTEGRIIEDTYDWFAQDGDGNVWYFGEDTTAYDEDGMPDEAGAWEAGVDGALPGVIMWADPREGESGYRQEYYAGEAEDMGQVIATSGSVEVPAGVFDDVIVTRDWTPLEPDAVEEKIYARGIGFIHESLVSPDGDETVVLVEHQPGG